MLIGHIPSGYIFGKLLSTRIRASAVKPGLVVAAGMLGAVAPDADMLYFYLIDGRQTHHHMYWSHYPILWIGVFLTIYVLHKLVINSKLTALGLVFTGGGIIHLLLDSVVGDIWWLAPFIQEPFSLASIPAFYKPWWLNFILHWSFAIEIILCFWALWLWRIHKISDGKS